LILVLVRVLTVKLKVTLTNSGDVPVSVDGVGVTGAQAAAFADGVTEISDAAELVVKESNRIGTLQAGRDADFLVLSGEPFAVGTMVETTWIDGKIAFNAAGEALVEAWYGVGAGWWSFPRFLHRRLNEEITRAEREERFVRRAASRWPATGSTFRRLQSVPGDWSVDGRQCPRDRWRSSASHPWDGPRGRKWPGTVPARRTAASTLRGPQTGIERGLR
jgi:hypothetical protein